MRVLDVAAGTGNASIPAAQRGAERHRERPDARAPRGRPRPRRSRPGVELDWVEADAEHLPFEDESFDVVMSSIGAMFAPAPPGRRRRAGARLQARRHDRHAELDARGHDRRAVPGDGAVRAAAASGRAAAAAVGRRGSRARAVRRPRRLAHARARHARHHRRSSIRTTTASTSRRATARRSSPAGNAAKAGREEEFDEALDRLLRRVEPRHRRRRALRAGVPGGGRHARVRPAAALRGALCTGAAVLLAGCGGGDKPSEPLPKAPAAMGLTSAAFQDGGTIPTRFTCSGRDFSPPLRWSEAPARHARVRGARCRTSTPTASSTGACWTSRPPCAAWPRGACRRRRWRRRTASATRAGAAPALPRATSRTATSSRSTRSTRPWGWTAAPHPTTSRTPSRITRSDAAR